MAASAVPHEGHKLYVIAVEDDEASALEEALILEKKDCLYDICATGNEFLKKLSTQHDMAIIDLELPDIPGVEIIEIIRTHSDHVIATMPIIVLTAHREHKTLSRVKELGVEGLLFKPFSSYQCGLMLQDFKCRHKNNS